MAGRIRAPAVFIGQFFKRRVPGRTREYVSTVTLSRRLEMLLPRCPSLNLEGARPSTQPHARAPARMPSPSRRGAGPTITKGGRPRGRSGAVVAQEGAVALRRLPMATPLLRVGGLGP
jgi:hypothetical protein